MKPEVNGKPSPGVATAMSSLTAIWMACGAKSEP